MYEAFYQFSHTPFSRSIPTQNLFRGNDSDELIEWLKYTAGKQLFAVVLGDSGCGKIPSCTGLLMKHIRITFALCICSIPNLRRASFTITF